MLKTPLGTIQIFIDDKPIEYEYKAVDVDEWCPDLDGRYSITINFKPDGNKHLIACLIDSYKGTADDFGESGERLELKSFCCNGAKVSIGTEGDAEYFGKERCSEDGYDYDNNYLKNGMAYETCSFTKTSKYVFGIAWLNNATANNEVQTWFGADPTTF